jgi:NAD(P)-dependent dehydrogenase (short-subunit alcohol dehydrogenase family)
MMREMSPAKPVQALTRWRSPGESLAGRRVLITGAARGIGAATARRLFQRGASVVVAGIEPEELVQVAADCGDALAVVCDVRDREQVETAVEAAVDHLGGLDVVIANAGVAAQLPLVGGDPDVFDRTIAVNLNGVYYTLRAAGPHIAHARGYALAVASLAAAVHAPLLGAYCASKAGVEALADSLRIELASSGARVGVAYFGELDTDMTRRGFGTEAVRRLRFYTGPLAQVTPLERGIDAIERGVARRARRVVAPGWVAPLLPIRMLAQRVVDTAARPGLDAALDVARGEHAPLTTPQPAGEGLGVGGGESVGMGPGVSAFEGPGAGEGRAAGAGEGPRAGAGEGPGAGAGEGAGAGAGEGPGAGGGEGAGAGAGESSGESAGIESA